MSDCGCKGQGALMDHDRLLAFQALCELQLGDCQLSREIRAMEDELLAHVGCGDSYASYFEEMCQGAKARLEGKDGWCDAAAVLVAALCNDP